jgi:hypothetical protein
MLRPNLLPPPQPHPRRPLSIRNPPGNPEMDTDLLFTSLCRESSLQNLRRSRGDREAGGSVQMDADF